jgi:HNH endonuclease/type III secretion system-like peptide-binding chaperone
VREHIERRPVASEADVVAVVDELVARAAAGELHGRVTPTGLARASMTIEVGEPLIVGDDRPVVFARLPYPGHDEYFAFSLEETTPEDEPMEGLYLEVGSGDFSYTAAQEADLRDLGWREHYSHLVGHSWWWLSRGVDDLEDLGVLALATFARVYGIEKIDLETWAERRVERIRELEPLQLPPERIDALADLESGPYSVTLKGVRAEHSADDVALQLQLLGYVDDPALILERSIHVRPETVALRLSERGAIALKKELEQAGARVEIRQEGREVGRPAVPVEVRREVWTRDGGQCVDCGSRENLEYDHIIPLSKGGANTVRNIELRCESCNRRKAASI